MFNFIKRWFPLKAESLEDFVSIIKREQCAVVEGQAVKEPKGLGASTSIGRIGHSRYLIELVAVTPSGRRVVYEEFCEDRFGSEWGFADAQDRSKSAIRCLLTAEDRLKKLADLLSPYKVQSFVKGPPGRLDERLLERLHKDAETLGVTPV